jgi:hypothetical protein
LLVLTKGGAFGERGQRTMRQPRNNDSCQFSDAQTPPIFAYYAVSVRAPPPQNSLLGLLTKPYYFTTLYVLLLLLFLIPFYNSREAAVRYYNSSFFSGGYSVIAFPSWLKSSQVGPPGIVCGIRSRTVYDLPYLSRDFP